MKPDRNSHGIRKSSFQGGRKRLTLIMNNVFRKYVALWQCIGTKDYNLHCSSHLSCGYLHCARFPPFHYLPVVFWQFFRPCVSLLFTFMKGKWRDKWVPFNTALRVLWLRMEERPPVWRVAANILNKKSRIADKGWSSSLGVGRRVDNSSP